MHSHDVAPAASRSHADSKGDRNKKPVVELTTDWREVCGEGADKNAPSPRQGHSATFVPHQECIIVFGGEGTSRPGSTTSKIFHNDCYQFHCKIRSWASLSCTGAVPSPRRGHAASLVDKRILVIFGGVGDGGRTRLYDCFRLNLGTLTWEKVEFKGILTQSRFQVRASITFDHFPDKVFLFGGASNAEAESSGSVNGVIHAVADMDLGSLTVQGTAGAVPSPRSYYSCVKYAARVVFFGGFDGTRRFNDVHTFDPKSLQWTLQETTGAVPTGRYKHTACVYGQFMFVVGGYSVQWLNEVCILDLQTWRWFSPAGEKSIQQTAGSDVADDVATQKNDPVYPRSRESHTTTAVGRFAYTFGGWSWPNCMSDMFRFNMGKMARICIRQARLSKPAPASLLDASSSKSRKKRRGSRRKSNSKVSLALGQSNKKDAWRNAPTYSDSATLTATADDMGRVSGYRDTSAARSAISPNFVLTAASFSKDTSAAEAHSVDVPLPKTAAFRSMLERSEEKRNMYNVGGPRIARADSNLLRASGKASNSTLPNIRQLTSTSTDSEDDNDNVSKDGEGSEDARAISSTDLGKMSPPPAQSSLSPTIKMASHRRRAYRQTKKRLSQKNAHANSGAYLQSSLSMRTTSKLNDSQKRLIESEVTRHVGSAVNTTQNKIDAQEQRKQKAAAGIAALREMLEVLDGETSRLSLEITEEESKTTDKNNDAFATKLEAQEKQVVAEEELGCKRLKASEERIQMLRSRLKTQESAKARVAELTENLEKDILTLKDKLEKDRLKGTEIDAESDSLGRDLQKMQDLVEEQKELRVALAEQLQALRDSRTSLQQELAAQTETLKMAEKVEKELRERVSMMVSQLAGPGVATEERPYETMQAGIFVSEGGAED
eukprot:g4453.t1